jgi:uncharacterized protein
MACSYCSQDAQLVRQKQTPQLLPSSIASTALTEIIARTCSGFVGVIFHGGEPTLAPQEWYREILDRALATAAGFGKSLDFSIQSNGQLIDDSWARFFRDYAFTVGISTDGPPSVSLPFRHGTARAARAIQTLQANGVKPGVLVVGTPRNLPVMDEVVAYLSSLRIRGFHIVPLHETGRCHGLSDATYREMLLAGYIRVAETLLAHPNFPVESRLGMYVSRFVDNPTIPVTGNGCQSVHKPCGKELVFVDETGGIYPCKSFHREEVRLGSATAEGILPGNPTALPQRSALLDSDRVRCALCAASKICSFGCAGEDRCNGGLWRCELAQGLFEYFQSDPERAVQLHRILNGRGRRQFAAALN